MPTEAEIEAAATAIRDVEDPMDNVFEFMPAARAALEAAERVRTKPECLEPNEE